MANAERLSRGMNPNYKLPGGRHDNDFTDFRAIDIYPTNEELDSNEVPFLQRPEDVFQGLLQDRTRNYLDWLFRLLREDMLAKLREDIQIALEGANSGRDPIALEGLRYAGYEVGSGRRTTFCAIRMECHSSLELFSKIANQGRELPIREDMGLSKHQLFGALCFGTTIVAFGTLQRDEVSFDPLSPSILVQFVSRLALRKAVRYLTHLERRSMRFVVVNTATFAYEPILRRLQQINQLPLDEQLLGIQRVPGRLAMPQSLGKLVEDCKGYLERGYEVEFSAKTKSGCSIRVKGAQLESLIHGLENELAQIQGPPGTGKSFIGALILLLILKHTNNRVLVLSYTNHAIDQFIEELMGIGVPSTDIVRLGYRSTDATAATKLDSYLKASKAYKLSRQEWAIIDNLRQEANDVKNRLEKASAAIAKPQPSVEEKLSFLKASESYCSFWSAFQCPEDSNNFPSSKILGKALTPAYLYDAWLNNVDVSRLGTLETLPIWAIPIETRRKFDKGLSGSVREAQVSEFAELAAHHDDLHRRISSIFDEPKRRVLGEKRILACTTTAAAMYHSIINTANPDVVMVEEAGEILEAHVITALCPSTKQLVLIGDHKQLRPKVNNYNLTVEKGDGYSLNVSLFERLIRHGNAFTTLQEQYRSHPDISSFARMLAYPQLQDAATTFDRDEIRGLFSRVTFVHHEYPEDDLSRAAYNQNWSANTSKKNAFEAQMVSKMVKYLQQQGYKTENMVVLTPYLGQLSLLRDTLRGENNLDLSEWDSCNLKQAGLGAHLAVKTSKQLLRLSTIDNYQGEESDIAIVSLTRSNNRGDIGFLSAQERLVVLMSRARKGIILFGNMHTYVQSKKGKNLWVQYFSLLKHRGWLFPGVPARCEQHPECQVFLEHPQDFDQYCPDGGCLEQCQIIEPCGHRCKRRCHRLEDHLQVCCQERLVRTCPRGHREILHCNQVPQKCQTCVREDAESCERALGKFRLE